MSSEEGGVGRGRGGAEGARGVKEGGKGKEYLPEPGGGWILKTRTARTEKVWE